MAVAMTARSLFVAGTHTDVGKTHVACALIDAARASGLSVDAFKPVVSGLDPEDWAGSDPGRLLTALGRDLTPEALEAVAPRRFRAPLSPPMAARLEGRRLELGEVEGDCRAWLEVSTADLRIIEGVGGLMSPVSEVATGLDLMAALAIPAVLVAGGYLGSISHTLTALAAAREAGVAIACVVVSQDGDPGAPDFLESIADLRRLAREVPIVPARRGVLSDWPQAVLDACRS